MVVQHVPERNQRRTLNVIIAPEAPRHHELVGPQKLGVFQITVELLLVEGLEVTKVLLEPLLHSNYRQLQIPVSQALNLFVAEREAVLRLLNIVQIGFVERVGLLLFEQPSDERDDTRRAREG